MLKPTFRPLVPALVLCLFLSVVSPSAARAASWGDDGEVSSLLGRLWGSFSAAWGKTGSISVSSGARRGRRTEPAPGGQGGVLVTANAGCIFDPNGLCRSVANVERNAGCEYDPNGRCEP